MKHGRVFDGKPHKMGGTTIKRNYTRKCWFEMPSDEEEADKKVIDIKFKGEYPANVLSNFYPHRFTFDGVECESMEGLLQSFKYRSVFKQRKVCKLSGHEAKAAGAKKQRWKKTDKVYWKGRCYKRCQERFHDLIFWAYYALYQNEVFREALDSTVGCRLDHSIGLDNPHETILTRGEFIQRLNLLRECRGNKQRKTTTVRLGERICYTIQEK